MLGGLTTLRIRRKSIGLQSYQTSAPRRELDDVMVLFVDPIAKTMKPAGDGADSKFFP